MQEIASGGFQIMWKALCRALDCQPGNILEYVQEEK
jgi:DNA-binding Xre family transcriptional regulator